MKVSLLTTEQHILNQRETYPLPSALADGLKATKRIAREMAFIKETSLFRTKWGNTYSTQNIVLQFRPKQVCSLEYHITTDDFPVHLPNHYHTFGAMHLD